MSEKLSFTIVVPACNIAPYADEMVSSIKAQTYEPFDVLILNEQSHDDSYEKLAAAIGDDPRFELIALPCSGSASISRNYGIEHARGEYLVFVDGDDWIEPLALEKIAEFLLKFQRPDLVLLDWILHRTTSDGREIIETIRNHDLPPEKLFNGPDSLALRLKTHFQPGSPAHVCRTEFMRSNHLYQIPGRRHQDCEWMPRVNFAAKTVVYMPYCYYHYRKRPSSVTTKPNPKSMLDLTDNIISCFDFIDTHEIPSNLVKPLADWCGENMTCFFADLYVRDYSRELRQAQFLRLAGKKTDFQRCAAVLRKGGISKKILLLIFRIGRLPHCFGMAEGMFRFLYLRLLLPGLTLLRSVQNVRA
ncbi:MAG: glycosyltransferase family A protein [Victivallaceae bacterium]|nr:glycosyltransferase family A protein [Victivallaceae bacterium]